MHSVRVERSHSQFAPIGGRLLLIACALFALLSILSPAGAAGAAHAAGAATAESANNPPAGEPSAASLGQLETAFADIVEQVTPSVVGIRVLRRYITALPTPDGSDAGTLERSVTVNGSGTLIDRRGLILTNEHVIQAADRIEVVYHDGRSELASILAADPRGDLAVLQVTRQDLPVAKFAEWASVKRGQWTIALGNPYGLGGDGKLCVSVGVIANLGRHLPGLGEVDDRFYADMLQTTAAIQPGCSGGPLFNLHGELLGVVTAMHTRAVADEGVGFAVPMSPARRQIVRRLCAGTPVVYGYLGMTVGMPAAQLPGQTGNESPRGVLVEKLEIDGPAQQAGLCVGDVVVEYNGQRIETPSQMAQLVGQSLPGGPAEIVIWRSGLRQTVRPIVEQRQVSRVGWMRGDAIVWRGLRIAELVPDARERMQVPAGAHGVVVLDVAADSPAGEAKISVGDVIERVDQAVIAGVGDFSNHVSRKKGAVKLSIRTRGECVVPPWQAVGR